MRAGEGLEPLTTCLQGPGTTSRDVHLRLRSGVTGWRKRLRSRYVAVTVAVNQAMVVDGRSRRACLRGGSQTAPAQPQNRAASTEWGLCSQSVEPVPILAIACRRRASRLDDFPRSKEDCAIAKTSRPRTRMG